MGSSANYVGSSEQELPFSLTDDVVSDASILARDIAGDAASNAATRLKPSEDRLNQIDDAAEDNTWHDVPDLSATNLRAQAKDQYTKNKPFSKADAQNAANQVGGTAQDENADTRAGAANVAGNLRDTAGQNVPEDTKNKARDFQNRTKSYFGEKVPKERRDQTIYRLKKMVVEIQSHSDCMSFTRTTQSCSC